MTSTDFEGLEALRDVLRDWEDNLSGVVRIELLPRDKYSGDCLMKRSEVPTLIREGLLFEVEEALDALTFLKVLRGLLERP